MNEEILKSRFDEVIDRRNTNSYKWDTPESRGVLPMWVADMDFRTCPDIISALEKVVERGIFGYTQVPDEFYQAASDWFASRHGYRFDRNEVIYTSGVVPAVSAIIKSVTRPGDEVALLTPAYNCFFSSIRNNGCKAAECPMTVDEAGKYTIDFNLLADTLRPKEVKAFILCNPHNPGGRVWTKEELLKIAELCLATETRIISDDIHCELVYSPYRYIPVATLGREIAENTVTCISPSKAFNTAGLQIALIVTANKEWQSKIDRAINDNEVCDVNPFGVAGLIAAYTEGSEWLAGLVDYLKGNRDAVSEIFARETPYLKVMPLEATYLAWVDITPLGMTADEVEEFLKKEAGVRISSGSIYHSDKHIRINFALSRIALTEAVEKMAKALKTLPAVAH